jgi:hypothetical protein
MQERSSATSGVVANPSAALCAFSPTSTPIARGKLVKRKIRSTRSGFSCPADQQHLGLSLRIACHYRHGAVVIRGYEIRRQLRDRSEAQCRSGISRWDIWWVAMREALQMSYTRQRHVTAKTFWERSKNNLPGCRLNMCFLNRIWIFWRFPLLPRRHATSMPNSFPFLCFLDWCNTPETTAGKGRRGGCASVREP